MDVRAGVHPHLERVYPEEVMPLVDELNGLLDSQEQTVERARAWTADLAHGLKTPLTVLTAEAQRLRDEGSEEIADRLESLAESMRRRVDRELIRARLRSGVQSHPGPSDCGEIIHGIVRTLQRIPGGEHLQWQLEVPERVMVSISPEDLAELLGNLLENASKWATQKVKVSLLMGQQVQIRIEDDGPGVPSAQFDSLGQRGMRLDQQKQGTGLGLAIALDISQAYDGQIGFEPSSLGGLAVMVSLPSMS
jgi:signal transduction histidine kinase